MQGKNAATAAPRSAHPTAAAAVKSKGILPESDDEYDRWASVPAAYTGSIHVYPLFGPKHSLTLDCWCHPSPPAKGDKIVMHNVAH